MVFNKDFPIYQQIMEILKQRILNQEIKPGELVPSVRMLAIEFGITTNTVQRAYTEMVRDNLLKPVRGLGNRVTDDNRRLSKFRKNYYDENIKKFYSKLKKTGIQDEDFLNLIQDFVKNIKK